MIEQTSQDYVLKSYRWPEGQTTITYAFVESPPPFGGPGDDNRAPYLGDGLDAGTRDLVREAMDTWESVCGVNFVEVADGGTVNVRISYTPGVGRTDPSDGAGGTTGDVWTWYSGNTIVEQTLRLDRPDMTSEAKIYDTALHELGHVLGIGHSDISGTVLSGPPLTSYTNQPGWDDLTADDIAAARARWGREPDAVSTWSEIVPDWNSRYGTTGTSGADTLAGSASSDTLNGGNGADLILGQQGNDNLVGGAGADTLIGGLVEKANGANTLEGGGGNDQLAAGMSALGWMMGETGTAGRDVFKLGPGHGNDTVYGAWGGADGAGFFGLTETIDFSSFGANAPSWQQISANLSSASVTSTLYDLGGSIGSIGSEAPSVVLDLSATITGGGTITFWNTRLAEIDATDFTGLSASSAPVVPTTATDVPEATGNADWELAWTWLRTQRGDSTAGGDDDLLVGRLIAQTLSGGGGSDLLLDQKGNDTLSGGAGNDTLFGGVTEEAGASNRLEGGAHDDHLCAGWQALNWLLAEPGTVGSDTFVFGLGHGNDTVYGAWGSAEGQRFFGATEKVDLTGFGAYAPTWANVQANLTTRGVSVPELGEAQSTILDLRAFGGGTITFWNTGRAELDPGDFIGLRAPAPPPPPPPPPAPPGSTPPSGGGSGPPRGSDPTEPEPEPEPEEVAPETGTAGDDQINGTSGNDTVQGAAGNDTLVSGAGADSLSGGEGRDALLGGTGEDTLAGGPGDDSLWGQDGADSLSGDAGHDLLFGQSGDDRLSGGGGVDNLLGGDGRDSLAGGPGPDGLWGEEGNDTLSGGADGDFVAGGAGADRCEGGAGADYLDGGAGADTLLGGTGYDIFAGGAGDDLLVGDPAGATMFGQSGRDTFVVDGGTTWIMDFEPVVDRIAGTGLTTETVGSVATQLGGHLHIDLPDGDLYLAWTLAGEIGSESFV